MNRQILCALDTSNFETAARIVGKLAPYVGGFKIGHALTMAGGLDILPRLQDAGASRIFLDLKFHDIPNSVALAVREAARRGVWMMTLHTTGGPAMMTAAAEEAKAYGESAPLLIGVSVLTSMDQQTLNQDLGVPRTIKEHMVAMSKLAVECELDGVVCSPLEVAPLRAALGKKPVIVTPGIRLPDGDSHDQHRVGDAKSTLEAGASYLVVGRALTESPDPAETLAKFGLTS